MTQRVCAIGLFVLLSAICLTSIASAQTSWWRTCGGAGDDGGSSVQQTTDGGYIIVGSTSSFGAESLNVYLIKTSASGDSLWSRNYGGPAFDVCTSVQQTSDGGYILAGCTESFGAGYRDVYLMKTNASGDTLWARTYGGTSGDVGISAQQTTDGGYIIAGWAESFGAGLEDVYLIKTNASGDTMWTRTYGGTASDIGYSVQQTTDGGYIITGDTRSSGAGNEDVYLIKTNASGDTLWARTYGGTYPDYARSVQQTTDGGYIIAGSTWSFCARSFDVYLVKTNASGDTLWTRTYGGTSGDEGYSVQQTTDGGYIIAGYTLSFGAGSYDVYLIRTNASGDTLWTRTYGGTSGDGGNSVQQTTDGGYIIAGWTQSFGAGLEDVYLIKTDSLGNVGVAEPPTRHPVRPTRFLVQPNPFTSFARVPGHEAELFALSDVSCRQVAICKGDRIGAELLPGVYFLSPVGLKTVGTVAATIVKLAF